MAADVELTLVIMTLDATDAQALGAVLARYVVVSRTQPGCRNIDLCVSVANPSRFVVVEKWESPDAQRAHLDSSEMVAMAESCRGLLRRPPQIELLAGVSAHDLA